MLLRGLRTPHEAASVLPFKRTLDPLRSGGVRACPGRKPKGVCGFPREASQPPAILGDRSYALQGIVGGRHEGLVKRLWRAWAAFA